MPRKFQLFSSQKVDKTTPFPQTFQYAKRIHFIYILSVLSYVVVAWELLQYVPVAREGFAPLPATTYFRFLLLAVLLSILLMGGLFLFLPKITSPAAIIHRKHPLTLEAFGFELLQAQILRMCLIL